MKSYLDLEMVLSLPGNVNEMIDGHKNDAARKIGVYENKHSPVHISIISLPRQKPFMIEQTSSILGARLRAMHPLVLTIDGFDHFNYGEAFRTIYARIRSTQKTAEWFKQLKKILNSKEYLVPHITIARNIPVDAFNQLWPHFKPLKWVIDFEVDHLTLLHREAFNSFARWEIYKELPFENRIKPEDAKPKRDRIDLRKGTYTANQQTTLF